MNHDDVYWSTNEIEKLIVNLNTKKKIYVNQATYDSILKQIDFVPRNLVVNNFIPSNMAWFIDEVE